MFFPDADCAARVGDFASSLGPVYTGLKKMKYEGSCTPSWAVALPTGQSLQWMRVGGGGGGVETRGSIHGTVGAVAMVRSRQTDMPVREVDAQYVDSVPSVVSVIHLPDSVCSRGFSGEGGAHRGECE